MMWNLKTLGIKRVFARDSILTEIAPASRRSFTNSTMKLSCAQGVHTLPLTGLSALHSCSLHASKVCRTLSPTAVHLRQGDIHAERVDGHFRRTERGLGQFLRDPGGIRRSMVRCRAKPWSAEQSPYDLLELEREATEEEVKGAYRRMAKKFHPDVYDGSTELGEGESAESRFISIQAAYELLMDSEERQKYDREHRQNPMRASRAFMEWVAKKKKAFEQRGDLAVSAWAEQQNRNFSLRARNLSKAKMDPEEERRLVAKERQANLQTFETTIKRHNLVLQKRDIMRKRAEEAAKKRLVQDLLALEGFEIDETESS